VNTGFLNGYKEIRRKFLTLKGGGEGKVSYYRTERGESLSLLLKRSPIEGQLYHFLMLVEKRVEKRVL